MRVTEKGALTFTALGIVRCHVPVPVHALVTTSPLHKSLADTSSGDKVVGRVGATLTLAPVLGANRVTVAA